MDVKEFFKNDRFGQLSGIELLKAENGMAKARMKIKDEHLNALNMVQGGAIFTLADLTIGAAANSYGIAAVAINVNISFLKAASNGVLFAEANECSRNSKIASYNVTITNEQGELISTAQGMVYIKKDKF
jgi:acyl-CoA thioesterase